MNVLGQRCTSRRVGEELQRYKVSIKMVKKVEGDFDRGEHGCCRWACRCISQSADLLGFSHRAIPRA